jgi:hypothetical protein
MGISDDMSVKVAYPTSPQLRIFARLDQQPSGGVEGYVQSNGPILVQNLAKLADKELFDVFINPQGTVNIMMGVEANGSSEVQLHGEK